MTTPTSEPQNIDEVILALQTDPIILVKDKSGQVGSQKTKYADLVQLNQVAMPRLTAYQTIYVTRPNIQEDARFALEWELKHLPSGTSYSGKYPLKLAEQPMQMGSAITYARRYILTSVLNIAAEDEDDDAGTGRGSAQRKAKRATDEEQQQAAQRKPSGPSLPGDNLISQPQMAKLQALFTEKGFTSAAEKKAFLERVVGHPLASTRDLTKAEAGTAIERLENLDEPGGAA